MNVYVAGKFDEKERVREVMRAVERGGHRITFDWTPCTVYSRAAAMADYTGVATAEVLILILEKDLPYRGAWTEFGIALALGIPVFVLGDYGRQKVNVFLEMPGVWLGYAELEARLGCPIPRPRPRTALELEEALHDGKF